MFGFGPNKGTATTQPTAGVDPWAGMREADVNKGLQWNQGGINKMMQTPEQQAQFSPVQFAGQSGNTLNDFLAQLLQKAGSK